jgi:hypothetical protein
LVIHGIGEQPPGTTRKNVLASLALAYPGTVPVEENGVGILATEAWQVRVYEVYWADILSGPAVDGSFNITSVQQLVWFPWLNHRRLAGHRNLYPRWLVVWWTFALAGLGMMLTAAYFGTMFLLTAFAGARQEVTKSARENRKKTGKRFEAAKAAAAQARPQSYALDRFGADVLNYVNAAGAVRAPVPDAEERIYQRLEDALKKATGDGCSEIQVLAHSLGTLIAYRAVALHHDRLSTMIDLPFGSAATGRPPLTGLFTIGSPLEKIRFFWPKLILGSAPLGRTGPGFDWHNFKSPLDPVAGMLRRYEQFSQDITNHVIKGSGGLITAHSGYLKNPAFLKVIGPQLTRQPIGYSPSTRRQVGLFSRALLETVGLPALLLFLAAAGTSVMLGVGYLAGSLFSWPVQWGGDALAWALSAQWTFPHAAADWIRQGFAWLVPVMLLVVVVLLASAEASKIHKTHWQWEEPEEAEQRNTTMSPTPRKYPGTIWHLFGSVALLVAIAYVGLRVDERARAWVIILVLMASFAVLNGQGITGALWGILIDSRNKMSLSRLQMLAWTLVVLSALITAILSNVAKGSDSPMDITIPSELWVLLGISTASAVGAPALLSAKRDKQADDRELNKTANTLQQQGAAPPDMDEEKPSVVIRNASIHDARFSELLKGDESGNASTVDMGKLQMFLFTFILACGYGAAIYTMFRVQDGFITAFPPVQDGMNVLLGISQTGYLANKAVSHSKEKTDTASAPPATGVEGRT